MLKFCIFANFGTDQKIFLPVTKEQIGSAMELLNQIEGGNWVFVDELRLEYLKFSDGLIYRGFSPNIDRYSTAIKKLP